MKAKILLDIKIDDIVFKINESCIVYDAKRPRSKKRHLLICKATKNYCELSQDSLELLVAAGYAALDRSRAKQRGNKQ